MIKRYGLGQERISIGESTYLMTPVVEMAHGDYVRYEDHFAEVSKMVEQMEAIGAGGVSSERITQQGKAIEQHRAEFEEWTVNSTKKDSDGEYDHYHTSLEWQAWKAARGITE